MITSLDGNVQLQDAPAHIATNKIKINITKNVSKNVINSENSEINSDRLTSSADGTNAASSGAAKQKSPPPASAVQDIVEEEITFEYKDSMKDFEFTKVPKINNGLETSGLCSIM